jgi:protein tyrosine/serine phosphatase
MSNDTTTTAAVGTSASSRFLSVGGVLNFRELGGYPCGAVPPTHAPNGSPDNASEATPWDSQSSIRPGFLFRSAQPSQITPAGIETLIHKLGIQAIFDFRSQTEIQLVTTRYPDSLLEIPGTTRYSVPVFKEGDYSPASLVKKYGVSSDTATDSTSSTSAKPEGFVHAYEAIARSAAENGSFRKITDHIIQHPDRPVLFHCTLGKDRTGVFAALLLSLCGVPNETIVEDYAMTTEGFGSWREHLIQRLLQRKDAATREDAEKIIASQPETMKSFIEDVVAAKFGSARNYFIQQCGMTEDEVDTLIHTLVIAN